jgi:transposase-like protein
MTANNGLPPETQVRQAFTKLVEQARHNGHRPSVLALARHFGLTNTTFRRHYPEIVKELGEIRRTPAIEHTDSPAATEHARIVARNAKLQRDNRQLRQHL